jgi:hypothetical protein
MKMDTDKLIDAIWSCDLNIITYRIVSILTQLPFKDIKDSITFYQGNKNDLVKLDKFLFELFEIKNIASRL